MFKSTEGVDPMEGRGRAAQEGAKAESDRHHTPGQIWHITHRSHQRRSDKYTN